LIPTKYKNAFAPVSRKKIVHSSKTKHNPAKLRQKHRFQKFVLCPFSVTIAQGELKRIFKNCSKIFKYTSLINLLIKLKAMTNFIVSPNKKLSFSCLILDMFA
jgi:hypothetical protein